jgi:hypothetical protein
MQIHIVSRQELAIKIYPSERLSLSVALLLSLARASSMAVHMIAAVIGWFRARLFIFLSAKPRDLLWMPEIYYFGRFIILRVTMMVRVR